MNNELHFHGPALKAAWRRISKQMGGRDVSECKIIWKSLKDAVLYRKNKIARTADDEPVDERYEYGMGSSNWEFSDCLSFLMDASSSVAMHPQRSSDFENSQTSETCRVSIHSTNNNTAATSAKIKAPPDCNDDASESESSFSYTASIKQQQQHQEDDPLFVESMVNMANSIQELAKGVTERQDRCGNGSLKFDYIWRNLDSFFQKLSSEDVDELNFKFIQMAYERVKKGKSS